MECKLCKTKLGKAKTIKLGTGTKTIMICPKYRGYAFERFNSVRI